MIVVAFETMKVITMVAAIFMTVADVGGGGGRNEARLVQAAILVLEGDVNGGGVAKWWQ